MTESSLVQDFVSEFKAFVQQNVPLSQYTYFRIGGAADIFAVPRSDIELIDVIKAAGKNNIRRVIIGEGSNLLIDDRGFRGLVIRMESQDPPEADGVIITVRAGCGLSSLLSFAAENSLSGFENLAGIPGTVGGAVFMNAGAYGTSVSELLTEARVLTPDGLVERTGPDFFDFGYRTSSLQAGSGILLDATFKLSRGNRADIIGEYTRIKSDRASKHPGNEIPCAGSYFKNLPPEEPGGRRQAAGMYLDKAGAKDFRVGGAAVFEKHANMIINTGSATSRDVLLLAEKMKQAAKASFGIDLEEEVRFLDAEKGFIR